MITSILKTKFADFHNQYMDGLITEDECAHKCIFEAELALSKLCSENAAQSDLDAVADILGGLLQAYEG